MTILPQRKFTVDEYLAWVDDKPGRFELHGGRVYAQASERAGHAEVKFAVQKALEKAIHAAGLPCRLLPDGMTVRVNAKTAYEPDALVYCGERVSPDAVEIANPVIVVEILSPSTRRLDASVKLAGYFQVPGIEHYLIVDPEWPPVIHHKRQKDGTILTRLVSQGEMVLQPPGFEVDVAPFFL